MLSACNHGHIRQGTNLNSRHLRWLVSDLDVPQSLLARSIIGVLGPETNGILTGAADKYAGTIYSDQRTMRMYQIGTGKWVRVPERVYHTDVGESTSDEEDVTQDWYDIGLEISAEGEGKFRALLSEAKRSGTRKIVDRD